MHALLLCCALAVISVVSGATCPSSGTVCITQCGLQWQQCSGTTFYPAQSVPAGTVCCNGVFVYPNDPCCASGTPAPTTTKASTATAAPTTTKASTATAAPTAPPTTGSCSLSQIFTQNDFNVLFPNANLAFTRGDAGQYGIFTYNNLIQAAASFPTFACTGTAAQKKRELAAFLAQTSQETTGWWAGQEYTWGYVYSTEQCAKSNTCSDYCGASADYPCVGGQKYYGRGPLQLSWNYNYGPASQAILGNKATLLNDPNQVLTNGVIAFKASLWFWMTAQGAKPSCHNVITGLWAPTSVDVAAGRTASFGMLTNIINGGIECQTGSTPSDQSVNRVGYYNRYANYFGVPDTANVLCNNMQHY